MKPCDRNRGKTNRENLLSLIAGIDRSSTFQVVINQPAGNLSIIKKSIKKYRRHFYGSRGLGDDERTHKR